MVDNPENVTGSPRRKVSPFIFGASVLCFFLPFVTLSCGNQKALTLSGVQLATGTTIEQPQMFGPPQRQKINPEPTVTIAALCAIAALLLSLFGGKKAVASSICGIAGAISLFVMKLRLDDAVVKQGQGIVQANYEIGYVLTLLLLAAGAIWEGYIYSQPTVTSTAEVSPVSQASARAGPDTFGGIPVVADEKPIRGRCEKCGAYSIERAHFCPECGHPIAKGASATPF